MSTRPDIDLIMNTTVGVEIEMTGITREAAAHVAASTLGTGCRVWYKGGTYKKWTCTDARGRDWDFVYDSSIQSPGGNSETKCELNTPPITYAEDMDKLQELIRALRRARAVSGTKYGCGIHIHVGAKDHDAKSVRNFIHLMYSNDELVRKSLGVTSDRFCWCKPIDARLIEADEV